MVNPAQEHPTLVAGAVSAAVDVTIAAAAYGLGWSETATTLAVAVGAAWTAVGAAVWTWRRVTPTPTD